VLALVPTGRLAAAGAPPCTITWDGGVSGSWHTPENWSPDRLPAPGDIVCVPAGASVAFSEGTASVATLRVDGELGLQGGTLAVTSTEHQSTIVTLDQIGGRLDGPATVLLTGQSRWTGGSMAGSGVTRVASGAVLDIDESGAVHVSDSRILDVRGTLDWAGPTYILGGASSALHVGAGGVFEINNSSSTYLPTRVLAGGTLRKSSAGMTQIGTTLKNSGRIEALSGTIAVTGPFRNMTGTTLGGGEYVLRGGSLRFYGANIVTNLARVTLDGPSGGIQDPSGLDAFVNFARNGPGAAITLEGGRNMTVAGLFRNEGTLVAKAGSTFSVVSDAFVNAAGGLLQGTGTIDANVGSAGEVAPGLSPGVLTINGNYVQQSDGGLRIELAGFVPETEYDRLVVTGFATLDGRLTLVSAPAFLPPVGAQFNIIGALRSGQFARVEGDLLLNGNWYAPFYNPANVQLIVQRGMSLGR
jgi:hypothetical protein